MERKPNKKPRAVIEETDVEFAQGIAETEEQIQDAYSAGGNELTFLRDDKDQAKKAKKTKKL